MQFGIFSVGDVTPDPTTGRTPAEAERIKAMVPSSPTTMLGYLAARTSTIILSTATTLITTNDPVKIAEELVPFEKLLAGLRDRP